MTRAPAVYYDQTYRHHGGPCCDPDEGLHSARTDVEVAGSHGADNGMFYWRARRAPMDGADVARWSTWRAHEPGSVVTQEELYWDGRGQPGNRPGTVPASCDFSHCSVYEVVYEAAARSALLHIQRGPPRGPVYGASPQYMESVYGPRIRRCPAVGMLQ